MSGMVMSVISCVVKWLVASGVEGMNTKADQSRGVQKKLESAS